MDQGDIMNRLKSERFILYTKYFLIFAVIFCLSACEDILPDTDINMVDERKKGLEMLWGSENEDFFDSNIDSSTLNNDSSIAALTGVPTITSASIPPINEVNLKQVYVGTLNDVYIKGEKIVPFATLAFGCSFRDIIFQIKNSADIDAPAIETAKYMPLSPPNSSYFGMVSLHDAGAFNTDTLLGDYYIHVSAIIDHSTDEIVRHSKKVTVVANGTKVEPELSLTKIPKEGGALLLNNLESQLDSANIGFLYIPREQAVGLHNNIDISAEWAEFIASEGIKKIIGIDPTKGTSFDEKLSSEIEDELIKRFVKQLNTKSNGLGDSFNTGYKVFGKLAGWIEPTANAIKLFASQWYRSWHNSVLENALLNCEEDGYIVANLIADSSSFVTGFSDEQILIVTNQPNNTGIYTPIPLMRFYSYDEISEFGNEVINSEIIDGGVYTIQPKNKETLYFDIENASKSNGALLRLYRENNSAAQMFKFNRLSDGTYKITAMCSNKVLEIPLKNALDNEAIKQHDWNNGESQHWHVEYSGEGYYHITAKHSDKAIDAGGNGSITNPTIRQYKKDRMSDAQKFRLTKVD
jgi:hypothetical protein